MLQSAAHSTALHRKRWEGVETLIARTQCCSMHMSIQDRRLDAPLTSVRAIKASRESTRWQASSICWYNAICKALTPMVYCSYRHQCNCWDAPHCAMPFRCKMISRERARRWFAPDLVCGISLHVQLSLSGKEWWCGLCCELMVADTSVSSVVAGGGAGVGQQQAECYQQTSPAPWVHTCSHYIIIKASWHQQAGTKWGLKFLAGALDDWLTKKKWTGVHNVQVLYHCTMHCRQSPDQGSSMYWYMQGTWHCTLHQIKNRSGHTDACVLHFVYDKQIRTSGGIASGKQTVRRSHAIETTDVWGGDTADTESAENRILSLMVWAASASCTDRDNRWRPWMPDGGTASTDKHSPSPEISWPWHTAPLQMWFTAGQEVFCPWEVGFLNNSALNDPPRPI